MKVGKFMKEIYLAGGCFWGLQKFMDQFEGIIETEVGYANGETENPKYPDVKAQLTGHAETLYVKYDSSMITLKQILEYFYMVIDPTSLNQQGEDVGTSYRTGIYYLNEEDQKVALEVTAKQQEQYDKKIVVEIEAMRCYYRAEEYHQKYLDKNPNGYCHIDGCFFHLKK